MLYPKLWGQLRTTRVPRWIVADGRIALDTPALTVAVVLMDSMRSLQEGEFASVRISRKTLINRTGYSVNKITEAIRRLKQSGYIEQRANWDRMVRRNKGRKFAACEYTLLNPAWNIPLMKRAGENLLDGKNTGYFRIPRCVIRETSEWWSLAQISKSEKRVYIACLILANRARRLDFNISTLELRDLVDLDPRTTTKALSGLKLNGLIWITEKPDGIFVELCDPYSGLPLETPDGEAEHDPANYHVTSEHGVTRRAVLNGTPEEIESFIRAHIPADGPVTVQGNGDLMILCPFHDDRTPSCSVSPVKRGAWQCFGCGERGNVYKLVAKLANHSIGESIQALAAARGQKAEFRRPDKDAIAIYKYRNRKGFLVKEVLRFPNDEQGKKVFSQRRPVPGGYVYSLEGIPPLLYSARRLDGADSVCIVEGEKDADTVTSLSLMGRHDPVIGVTSGGADSWSPILARELRNMRVVLMPDDDEPGSRYAERVRASLEAEGIEYRIVNFAGTGAKDVTEFVTDHTVRDLVRLVGSDWIRLPDGSRLDPGDDPMALMWHGPHPEEYYQEAQEITI
jgi:CTP-dependent riboflavin kinase